MGNVYHLVSFYHLYHLLLMLVRPTDDLNLVLYIYFLDDYYQVLLFLNEVDLMVVLLHDQKIVF